MTGTGGISILLDIFPYGQGMAMKILSVVMLLLNLTLFLTFSLWAIVRYLLYPKDWECVMKSPTLSLFWGCFPMGFATIMNVAINVLFERFSFGGKKFVYFIWALWWINFAISSACCWGIVHYMCACLGLSIILTLTKIIYSGSRVRHTRSNK